MNGSLLCTSYDLVEPEAYMLPVELGVTFSFSTEQKLFGLVGGVAARRRQSFAIGWNFRLSASQRAGVIRDLVTCVFPRLTFTLSYEFMMLNSPLKTRERNLAE